MSATVTPSHSRCNAVPAASLNGTGSDPDTVTPPAAAVGPGRHGATHCGSGMAVPLAVGQCQRHCPAAAETGLGEVVQVELHPASTLRTPCNTGIPSLRRLQLEVGALLEAWAAVGAKLYAPLDCQ